MSKGHTPWSVPEPPPQQPSISGLDYEGLQRCIHCGFCIQVCPTYRQTQVETASPRGRLALMRALSEGKIQLDGGFADPIDLCLGCRACESACPSGVPYGHLLEQVRALAAAVTPSPWYIRLALRHLLPYPRRLRALARLAQRLRPWRLLPAPLRELAAALPRASAPAPYPRVKEPAALFFHGCVQEALLPQQNRAAVRLITEAGSPCAVPAGQVCCGALHAHAGDVSTARALARRNIALFERYAGPIINHAGGCGAHLKAYGRLLAEDREWAERAAHFSTRVQDLSEYLCAAPLPPEFFGGLPATIVTYQDSCHLVHGQKIFREPRALLRAVPGLTLREMVGADQCCGSAGLYNLLQPETAGRVLSEKMEAVMRAQAMILVTTNPGCYLQLRQGVRRCGLQARIEVLSLAELLDRARHRTS